MKNKIFLLALLSFLALNAETTLAQNNSKTTSSAFDALLDKMLHFSIPILTAEQLHERIYEKKQPILLLDAREDAEYTMSHLATAKNIGFNKFKLKSLLNTPKETPTVVYCSIGYRSERIGEQLKKAGFTNVYNLYGGIFDWSNRGFPLVDTHEKPTKKVHNYNAVWGLWLHATN